MNISQGQLGLFPEGANTRGSALHGAQALAGGAPEVGEIVRAEVRESVLFDQPYSLLQGHPAKGNAHLVQPRDEAFLIHPLRSLPVKASD